MTNTRARTLHLTVTSALEQAYQASTMAAARCCLETALDAMRQLKEGGRLTDRISLMANETRIQLSARGWTI